MKIPEHPSFDTQFCRLGRHSWSVVRLAKLAESLPVMEVPIDHLNLYNKYESLTLRQMVMHMKAVEAADLSCPIIMDEDGELMDGRHRVMKAMLRGVKAINAVRFDENPPPCQVHES